MNLKNYFVIKKKEKKITNLFTNHFGFMDWKFDLEEIAVNHF